RASHRRLLPREAEAKAADTEQESSSIGRTAGLAFGAMKNTFSIDIEAPPERVFAWLGDGERAKQWVPNLVENEDLTKTPNVVGSTFRHVYIERGKRME